MNHLNTLRLMTEMHPAEDLEGEVNSGEALLFYLRGNGEYDAQFQEQLVSEFTSFGINLEEFILPRNCDRSDEDFRRANYSSILIRRICSHEIMDLEKEKRLLREKSIRSRNEIISHYYRFIRKQTKKYALVFSIDNNDCFQEGVIGFMENLEKYDPEKIKLIIYGYYGVNGRLNKFAPNYFKTVSVPDYFFNLLQNIVFRPDDHHQTLKERVEEDKRGNHDMNFRLKEFYHLNMEEPNIDILDIEEKFTSQETPFTALEEKTRDETITALLDEDSPLNKKERKILQMHYGIDEDKQTLKKIGEELGVTRERVRQIEEKALEKLKEYLTRQGIKDIRELGIAVR